jgi:hypothetical protein
LNRKILKRPGYPVIPKRTDIGKALITRESVNNVDKDHGIYGDCED